MKLFIESTNSYVYSDVMVFCRGLEALGENEQYVKNPTLIVEVLSNSTVEYDRRDKF